MTRLILDVTGCGPETCDACPYKVRLERVLWPQTHTCAIWRRGRALRKGRRWRECRAAEVPEVVRVVIAEPGGES